MKSYPDFIEKILPYGDLLRGFSNQTYITKVELNSFLNSRGIFHKSKDKVLLAPTMATLLLSPNEFDTLREFQNTREDNQKKSTSRIDWKSENSFKESLRNLDINELIPTDGVNFKLTSPPNLLISNSEDKATIDFEIERFDLNKIWYAANNVFTGKIEIEKTKDNQLKIVKSYTSNESNFVGDEIEKKIINHFKESDCIQKDKVLSKILFSDFNNADRIIFFYRLSSNMNSSNFDFRDIVNMEFTPEVSFSLPQDIEWMENKTELKLKGSSIHNTFFIRDSKYHEFLKVWEIESSFKFDYKGAKGNCNLIFGFKDYTKKLNDAEFTIALTKFSINNSADYTTKDKNRIKRNLLDVFDVKKDQTYINFLKYLKKKKDKV